MASRYRTSTFDYITERNEQVKLVPVSDELFDEMKKKEMSVREKKDKKVVLKQRSSVKDLKLLEQPTSPSKVFDPKYEFTRPGAAERVAIEEAKLMAIRKERQAAKRRNLQF